MSAFTPDAVDAVLAHMNDDHRDDNVLIVRAFAGRDVTSAVMSDVDARGATWHYTAEGEQLELHIPWSSELTERPQVRREIVALYDAACAQLGVEPRPH
jgi:Protein of unknown function (DUF2470)